MQEGLIKKKSLKSTLPQKIMEVTVYYCEKYFDQPSASFISILMKMI